MTNEDFKGALNILSGYTYTPSPTNIHPFPQDMFMYTLCNVLFFLEITFVPHNCLLLEYSQNRKTKYKTSSCFNGGWAGGHLRFGKCQQFALFTL